MEVMSEFDIVEKTMMQEFSQLTKTVKEIESVLSHKDPITIIDTAINKLPDYKRFHNCEGSSKRKVKFPNMEIQLELPQMTRKTFFGKFEYVVKHARSKSANKQDRVKIPLIYKLPS